MVTYVSTRVDFGTPTYFTGSPGSLALSGTTITPSSYSMVEPVYSGSSSTGSARYWKYTAAADGAVRIDPMLSMPGINTHLNGYVQMFAMEFVEITSGSVVTENVPLHVEGYGSTPVTTLNVYANSTVVFGTASFAVETGKTYIIGLRSSRATGAHLYWGLCLRMSSFRAAEPTWYQVPDRTVHTYSNDSGQGYDNDVVGVDDEENYWQSRPGIGQFGADSFNGNFKWSRSFAGLDPVSGIGSYLAVTHAWQHCCSESRGIFPTVWAAPDFDGTQQGVPPEYPYAPAHYGVIGSGGIDVGGGVGGVGAWNLWRASHSGIGFAEYADSSMEQYMAAIYMSLSKEAFYAGRMVGWTEEELIAFAGFDPPEVVGLIYEDDDYLPEVVRVRVVPDWNGSHVVASTWVPAPAQWWVAKSRYLPEMNHLSGFEEPDDPAEAGVGWGPYIGTLGHPSGNSVDQPQWVLGDTSTGKWPHGYMTEMNMHHLGDYESFMKGGGLQVWEIPEDIWRAGVDVEAEMAEYDVPYDVYDDTEDEFRFWAPIGMTFFVGTAEVLAAYPISPGVTQPSVEEGDSHAKGLHGLTVWPLITFRPSRFKVALAPEIEIPLFSPTGGPPTLRQHFEPIPME